MKNSLRGLSRVVALAAVAAAATSSLVTPSLALSADPEPAVSRIAQAVADAPREILQQTIQWRDCPANMPNPNNPAVPPGSVPMQCGFMMAPMNWYEPNNGKTIYVAVTRVKGTENQPRLLVANPGGPGAPGLGMSVLMKMYGFDASHMLVDMDPRGSGNSTSITCGSAMDGANDPRDRSAANLTSIAALNQVVVDQCRSAQGGMSQFITTEQIVGDLDLLRTVLKREKLDFYGTSAGAWLGAHYQKSFPQQSGRFAFDSTPDATSTWQAAYEARPEAMWTLFSQIFANWVAQREATFKLGTTPQAVVAHYEKLRSDFNASPLRMNNWGVSQMEIDGPALDAAIATSMRSKDQYINLAYLFGAARTMWDNQQKGAEPGPMGLGNKQQDAVRSVLKNLSSEASSPFGKDSSFAAYHAITCQDTAWQQGRSVAEKVSGELGAKAPLTGFYPVMNPCYYWQTTSPRRNVPDRAPSPTLMLQSQFDPITPLNQASAFAQKYGALMVTVQADADHRVIGRMNGCVDEILVNFFTQESAPSGPTCPGTGIPEPGAAPRESRKGVAAVSSFTEFTGPMGKAFTATMKK